MKKQLFLDLNYQITVKCSKRDFEKKIKICFIKFQLLINYFLNNCTSLKPYIVWWDWSSDCYSYVVPERENHILSIHLRNAMKNLSTEISNCTINTTTKPHQRRLILLIDKCTIYSSCNKQEIYLPVFSQGSLNQILLRVICALNHKNLAIYLLKLILLSPYTVNHTIN